MKILKHIKRKRIIKCDCGCKFKFDTQDIIKVADYGSCYPHVACPDCGKRHYL